MATRSEAPAWFEAALAHGSHEYVAPDPAGALAYRCWNPEDGDKPALLLAHGYRAHSRWWDAVAPFLTERFRVFALDFAGMGDSAARRHYDGGEFTANIRSVLDHAGVARATLVGHSYGGMRVLRACAEFPERIEHAIILDSYVAIDDRVIPRGQARYGRTEPYPSFEAAMERFRLLPEQPGEPYVRAHLGRHSIREVTGGWNWKFDRELPYAVFERDAAALLARITVPVDIVCGEHSVVQSPAHARRVVAALTSSPRVRGPIVMPAAHHHLMIDQPLALVAVLRALLA